MADSAVRAATASGADVVLRQVLQFFFIVILSRILTPADFGVVALAMVVVVVLGAVADLGIRVSVVRSPTLDDRTIATAYCAVGVLGVVLALCTAWAAPLLDRIPQFDGVGSVLPALAPVIAMNAVGGVSSGILVRRLRFWTLAAVGVAATIGGGLAAFGVAARADGPAALVAMALVSAGIGAIVTTAACRPRLGVRPAWRELCNFVQFGRHVVGTMLVDTAATRVPLVAVGYGLGSGAAGLFSRADGLCQAFKELTDSLLGRVSLPLLARSLGDDEAFVTGLRTGYRFGTALVAPTALLFAGVATPLVVVVYGPQWDPAGPLLAALLVGTVVWPVSVVSVNALLARGLSRTVFVLDLRNKLILVVCAVGGVFFGPLAVAWGVALSQTIAALLNMRALGDAAPYPMTQQLRDTVPITAVSVPWALAVWAVTTIWNAAPIIVAPTMVVAGALGIYVTARVLGVRVVDDVLRRLFGGVGSGGN